MKNIGFVFIILVLSILYYREFEDYMKAEKMIL
jgi:hypothetical protein